MTDAPTRAVLAALGGSARFVGGAVRDALLGRAIGDVDLATPLEPDEVARRLIAAAIKVVPTGLKHGTVTAVARPRHVQADRTAPLAGIEQGWNHAGIFSTWIKQHAAAARWKRIHPDFQAGIHPLRMGDTHGRQPKGGRNNKG